MEKFIQKWAIIGHIEPINEGEEYHYKDFPLHITFAAVFWSPQSGSELSGQLAVLLRDQSKIEIRAESEAHFGPNQDIPVTIIQKSKQLISLYDKIHTWLVELGAVYNEPQYQGAGYIPHGSYVRGRKLTPGHEITVHSVSLIDFLPHDDGYQRRVFKTFHLV